MLTNRFHSTEMTSRLLGFHCLASRWSPARTYLSLVLVILIAGPAGAELHGQEYGRPSVSQPRSVSIVTLLSGNGKHDGEIVRTIGVFWVSFESHGLYLTKEHLTNNISKNALWLDFDYHALGANEEMLKVLNGCYVAIMGTFRQDNTGHLDMNTGAMERVHWVEAVEPECGSG